MKSYQPLPHLTVFQSALFQTTTTVIHTDDHLLLVDPNWLPQEVEHIAAFVAEHGAGKPNYLLFTHSDYDHIIGYGRFPDCTTLASLSFTRHPRAAAQLKQATDWDDANYVLRDYPVVYPSIDDPIAGDGTRRTLGTDDYEFYQAPGHNYDGLLTWNRSRGVLIVGDYLSNVEFPYVYESFRAYRATLAKLETILATGEVRALVSGHGDPTTDPAEMRHRLAESREYLDELETAVRAGVDYDFQKIRDRYAFPVIMQDFHDKNVALLRQELGLSSGPG